MQPLEQTTRPRGAGGTPGGIGEFLLGLGMAVAGGYWLTSSVTVSSGYWTFWGHNAFGLSPVPLVLGCGILFFNGKSILGWLMTFSGAVIIVTGIIMNLHIYFRPTSLRNPEEKHLLD